MGQTFDIALCIVAEGKARMRQNVDIVFQRIRDAEIPHGRGDDIAIKGQEMVGPCLQLLPDGGLIGIYRMARQQMIPPINRVMIKGREFGGKDIQLFHLKRWITLDKARQQMISHHRRSRSLLTWAGNDMQQPLHAASMSI